MSEDPASRSADALPPTAPLRVELPPELVAALGRLSTRDAPSLIERAQPYLGVAFVVVAAVWTVAQFVLFSRVQSNLEIEAKSVELARAKGRSLAIEHTVSAVPIDGRMFAGPTTRRDYLVTVSLTLRNNAETTMRVQRTTTALWVGELQRPLTEPPPLAVADATDRSATAAGHRT